MKKQGQHASVKYLQVKKRSIVSNDKDGKNVKPVHPSGAGAEMLQGQGECI